MFGVARTCIFDRTLLTKIDNRKSFNFKTILNFLKIAYSKQTMGKRPRIPKTEKLPEVNPPSTSNSNKKEFTNNAASENAKLIHIYNDFQFEIWIDKHYEDRVNYGDENGQREGIEQEIVLPLIIESIKYIFHFFWLIELQLL